ncbi:MAG: hypothetical protein ACFFDH_21125 [Promethearchaeota archaeon]
MSEGEKLTAVKLLAFIGMLYLGFDAISYFYGSSISGNELWVLYGIIELVFAIVIFLGLNYWEIMPISLPFTWWILLIIGVVTIIFGFLASSISYWAGAIVTSAALIDLLAEKQGWKASKMMALVGAGFGIYDCIIIFMGMGNWVGTVPTSVILNGVFGLILAIILIIIIFDLVDIKIPWDWWVLLIIGFVFFMWVGGSAGTANVFLTNPAPIVGWSGRWLLISFLLLVLAF